MLRLGKEVSDPHGEFHASFHLTPVTNKNRLFRFLAFTVRNQMLSCQPLFTWGGVTLTLQNLHHCSHAGLWFVGGRMRVGPLGGKKVQGSRLS